MTATKPLVSLGIPVYNCEELMPRLLDTLLAQTYQNLEIVISDNASTDNTGRICKEYANKDSRIKYYRNGSNIGVYGNFRRTVELATGEYFMWAAADDIKPPEAIEVCANAMMKNPEAVMAHGIVIVAVPGESFELPNVIRATEKSPANRIRSFVSGIEHNAILYGLHKLSVLRQARFGSHLGQDYLLCLQMFLMGQVEYVDQPIIVFRQRQPAPIRPPMYLDQPLTVMGILTANRLQRRKCWTVLFRGAYYLTTRGKIKLTERVKALGTFVAVFGSKYKARLAKEIIFQISQPIAWLSTIIWRLARQRSATLRLARKLKACLLGT